MADSLAISAETPAPRAAALWLRPSLRLTALVGGLACLGLVIVASAAAGSGRGEAHFRAALTRRLFWTALGLMAFAAGAAIHYQRWRRHHMALGLLALGGLTLVLLPGVGAQINGARRWFRLAGRLSVQPSEFAKIALIIWIAAYCERCAWSRDRRTGEPVIRSFSRGFLAPASVAGLAALLVLCEPDFGTAVLIGVLCTSVMLVCGTRLVYVMLAMLAAVPLAHKLIISEPYRMARLLAFVDPWSDADGSGYQLIQSMIAIGSGGLTGKGLGLGVQKMGFLPAATNDFIFSIVAEEMGFIGGVIVVAAYAWLLWEGLKVALRARDTFGFALAFGITALIGLQAAVNIAVVTGSLPTKGLSLPFVSAGGSSLLMTMWAAGMLVNVARSEESPERFKLTPWYSDVPAYDVGMRSAMRGLAPGSGGPPMRGRR